MQNNMLFQGCLKPLISVSRVRLLSASVNYGLHTIVYESRRLAEN